MKTKSLHIIIALWAICLACVSCSQEEMSQPVSAGDGQVKIVYKVAGTSLSRAPEDGEDGWDGDWNENTIIRVDLFVFNVNNTLYKHLDTEDLTIEPVADGKGYTVAGTERLTYSEATADKKYYMIANCPQLENATIDDFSDLQAMMINPNLDCNKKQSTFVMDAKGTFNTTGELSILTFDLKRAAAKIRLSVQDKDGKDIINQCSFQLINYVSTGTSVLAESEKWGERTYQNRASMNTAQGWDETLQYEETGSMFKAVFYSYPNDWFDESLLKSDGTFDDPEIYAKDNLIDETKQTYILLTYEGNEFKVPVNFSIADNNDKTSFIKEEIEKLRNDYYRMQRNYIYDVTVTMDWEETNINVTYDILVNAWNDKGNMDITFGDPNQ